MKILTSTDESWTRHPSFIQVSKFCRLDFNLNPNLNPNCLGKIESKKRIQLRDDRCSFYDNHKSKADDCQPPGSEPDNEPLIDYSAERDDFDDLLHLTHRIPKELFKGASPSKDCPTHDQTPSPLPPLPFSFVKLERPKIQTFESIRLRNKPENYLNTSNNFNLRPKAREIIPIITESVPHESHFMNNNERGCIDNNEILMEISDFDGEIARIYQNNERDEVNIIIYNQQTDQQNDETEHHSTNIEIDYFEPPKNIETTTENGVDSYDQKYGFINAIRNSLILLNMNNRNSISNRSSGINQEWDQINKIFQSLESLLKEVMENADYKPEIICSSDSFKSHPFGLTLGLSNSNDLFPSPDSSRTSTPLKTESNLSCNAAETKTAVLEAEDVSKKQDPPDISKESQCLTKAGFDPQPEPDNKPNKNRNSRFRLSRFRRRESSASQKPKSMLMEKIRGLSVGAEKFAGRLKRCDEDSCVISKLCQAENRQEACYFPKLVWRSDPQNLINGSYNFTVNYLGSSAIAKGSSDPDPIKSTIDRLKKTSKNSPFQLPRIELSISIYGVKLLNYKNKELLSNYDIKHINSVCQDQDDLSYFAFSTQTHPNAHFYSHVFSCKDKHLSTKIILTIGQAFDVAFELFCKNSLN